MGDDILNIENETSVFSVIRSHMLEGLMFHDQMYNAFLFLRLYEFAKDHKNHYKEENKSFKKLNKYYITHRNMLIEEINPNISSIIPQDLYKKTRFDIDNNEFQKHVAYLIDEWVDWERKTKELYTEGYNKLVESGFAAESEFIMKLVKDVDNELAVAESLQLELEAMKYDVIEIMKMNE